MNNIVENASDQNQPSPQSYYSRKLDIEWLQLALSQGNILPIAEVKEEIGGYNYVYNVSGNPRWKKVVHLHWLVGSKENFRSQMQDTSFADCYNIAIDLHADVEPNTKLQDMDKIIEYIYTFVTNKHLKKIVLHWVSLGGEFAYKFAAKYPTIIDKLILSWASWLQHENLQFADIEKAKRLAASKDLMKRMIARQFAEPQHIEEEINNLTDQIHTLVNNDEGAMRVVNLAMHTQTCDIGKNISMLSKLSHMHMPIYLLWGEKDKITEPWKVIPQFVNASRIPKDNVHMFPTWHTPNIEKPDLYNVVLKSILNKNSH